jgi:hypothetical protein
MNVASARPIRQPCGEGKAGDKKAIGRARVHAPRESRVLSPCCARRPAGLVLLVAASELCVSRMDGWIGACALWWVREMEPPAPAGLPLARISTPCPRGDPHEAASEKAPRKASHSRHAAPTGRPPPPPSTGTAHDAANAVCPVGFLRDRATPECHHKVRCHTVFT